MFFQRHHPVYVSSTEVNGTAIATGAYPMTSGIMANTDYRPLLGWLGPNATQGVENIRRGDLMFDGHYILVPTVPEILHESGYRTIVAGSKPVALLHDRALRRAPGAASESVMLYGGHTIPRALGEKLIKVNHDQPIPANTSHPNTAVDAWTTRALIEGLWKTEVPKYTRGNNTAPGPVPPGKRLCRGDLLPPAARRDLSAAAGPDWLDQWRS